MKAAEEGAPVGRRGAATHLYVPLVEALTWLAFGDIMTLEELQAEVEGGQQLDSVSLEERDHTIFFEEKEGASQIASTGHFVDRQAGLDRLAEAWQEFRDAVSRCVVKIRGRFSPTYSLPDACLADVENLDGNVLATYSQFDVSTGGIRRQPAGSPDILWRDHPSSFDREYASFGDEEDKRAAGGYLLVEVERSGLFETMRSNKSSRAPSFKAGHAPDDESILAKADEMKMLGINGRDIAKGMRHHQGFENVATTRVRELIKGRWEPGRPVSRKDT